MSPGSTLKKLTVLLAMGGGAVSVLLFATAALAATRICPTCFVGLES
jgi:hypothetical protein